MFKLDDQTKADLAKAWADSTPMFKKIGLWVFKAVSLLTAFVIAVVLLFTWFPLGCLWIALCGAGGVFYLNYRDAVWERKRDAELEAARQRRKAHYGL